MLRSELSSLSVRVFEGESYKNTLVRLYTTLLNEFGFGAGANLGWFMSILKCSLKVLDSARCSINMSFIFAFSKPSGELFISLDRGRDKISWVSVGGASSLISLRLSSELGKPVPQTFSALRQFTCMKIKKSSREFMMYLLVFAFLIMKLAR